MQPVQNIPAVSSTSVCHQYVLTNLLTSTVCEERHLLKPFSNDESGAVTITSQNLTLLPGPAASAAVSKCESRGFGSRKNCVQIEVTLEMV